MKKAERTYCHLLVHSNLTGQMQNWATKCGFEELNKLMGKDPKSSFCGLFECSEHLAEALLISRLGFLDFKRLRWLGCLSIDHALTA